jgi:hypothetical protein
VAGLHGADVETVAGDDEPQRSVDGLRGARGDGDVLGEGARAGADQPPGAEHLDGRVGTGVAQPTGRRGVLGGRTRRALGHEVRRLARHLEAQRAEDAPVVDVEALARAGKDVTRAVREHRGVAVDDDGQLVQPGLARGERRVALGHRGAFRREQGSLPERSWGTPGAPDQPVTERSSMLDHRGRQEHAP